MRFSPLWELLFCSILLAGPVTTAHAQEFRRVTLADGSSFSGIVKAGDAENLVLETLNGDVNLPFMDIIQIEPLDRETVLHETDGYLLCLPLPPGTPETEDALAQRLCMAMRRDLLDPVPFDHLSPDQQQRLRACADMRCSAGVATEIDAGRVLATQVSPSRNGYEVSATLYRVDEGHPDPVRTARVTVQDAGAPTGAIARCSGLLLGEVTQETSEQATPQEPGVAVSNQETGTEAASSSQQTATLEETEAGREQETGGQNVVDLDLKKYDFIPVPGLASNNVFERPGGTAVATGAVVAVTGLTVYVVGDLRVVGSDRGLSVPWTFENRGIKDGVLLTGTGVATYCLTTWVANVLVRKYFTRKGR